MSKASRQQEIQDFEDVIDNIQSQLLSRGEPVTFDPPRDMDGYEVIAARLDQYDQLELVLSDDILDYGCFDTLGEDFYDALVELDEELTKKP